MTTLMGEWKDLDPKDECYEAKFKVLMEQVEYHLEEEEGEMPVALLLIDVINDLEFDGGEALLAHALPMATQIAALKRRAKHAGIPAIYVNDNFGRMSVNFPENLLADGQRSSRPQSYGGAWTQAYRLTDLPARARARSPARSPEKRRFE